MEIVDLLGEVRAWIDRLGLSMEDAARHAAIDREKLDRLLDVPGATTRELLQVLDGLGLGIAGVQPLTPAKLVHFLDRARAAKSITQKELARSSGVNRTHLNGLFKSSNPNPKAETIVKIAAAIECPLSIEQRRALEPLPPLVEPLVNDPPGPPTSESATEAASPEAMPAPGQTPATGPTSATRPPATAAAPPPLAAHPPPPSSGAASPPPSAPASASNGVASSTRAPTTSTGAREPSRTVTAPRSVSPPSAVGSSPPRTSPPRTSGGTQPTAPSTPPPMTPEVSAEDFKSLESKVDRLTDELEDQRRSSESEMSRVIRETNEALAAQRAEAKAAAEKDVLKATLVTGGTAAAAATATAIILDQVIDEDDDDHVGEIVTGLGSAGLIGAGAACEPGSTGRQVAFALGFGGLAGLAYHLYRRSQKPKPEPGRIGVDVDFLKDALDVTKVDEDSPAARAGIEVGDKIMSVDGHKASHGAKKVAKRLVGPVGGKVQIEVRRPRTWQLLKLTLVREAL